MTAPSTTRSSWIEESDCSLDEFREQVSRDTHPADYPRRRAVHPALLALKAAGRGDRDLADGHTPAEPDTILGVQKERRIP